ncbi:MAG: zinc metallopeptidase [Gammaproteobacteria bacterium]|nr:zinc metallopeptidase [Gammaproteobacteria bacterium]
MHPILIIVPAAVLLFGPRFWVKRVMGRYNHEDGTLTRTGRELAREILDQHALQLVKVESSDIGDHYDPEARAVRLSRDKIDLKSLTAVTTAAHEVSHAIQHAEGYGPFVWRAKLAKVAQVTGEAGSITLLIMPVATLLTGYRPPTILVVVCIVSILGTGMAAQLASLPTEFDASFKRALPLLRDDYINEQQLSESREILLACSLTYVAASLLSVLNFWPWFPRPAGFGMSVQSAFTSIPRADVISSESIGVSIGSPRKRGDSGLGSMGVVADVLQRIIKTFSGRRQQTGHVH